MQKKIPFWDRAYGWVGVIAVVVTGITGIVIIVIGLNTSWNPTYPTAKTQTLKGSVVRNISNIEAAVSEGERADNISAQGKEFGLGCTLNPTECSEVIARAKKNPALKAALGKVMAAGVGVYPRSKLWLDDKVGEIGPNLITINVSRTDSEIIAFLTQ